MIPYVIELIQPKFGNVLKDSPKQIMETMDTSMKLLASGVSKNHENIKTGKAGTQVEEGIPPIPEKLFK